MRSARMQQAELYLHFATECLKRAARMREPAHRQQLSAMAEQWFELAEELRIRVRKQQDKLTAEIARTSEAATHFDRL